MSTPKDYIGSPMETHWSDEGEDQGYDPPEEREEDEEGCVFPGQCCMPGPHRKSECHTAEMIQDFEREVTRGRKWERAREY